MAWLIVVGFILFGIGLVIIETIFIPGTTIVGIFGFLFVVVGVYQTFSKFGSGIGWFVLAITATVLVGSLLFSFKSGAWEKLALNQKLEGRLFEKVSQGLTIGDKGSAASSLKPIGFGLFNDKEFEVTTLGEYIDAGSSIEIIKIERNKIIVKSLIETNHG